MKPLLASFQDEFTYKVIAFCWQQQQRVWRGRPRKRVGEPGCWGAKPLSCTHGPKTRKNWLELFEILHHDRLTINPSWPEARATSEAGFLVLANSGPARWLIFRGVTLLTMGEGSGLPC